MISKSSEESGFAASHLAVDVHDSKSGSTAKYWLSSGDCDFPQTLVLAFDSLTRLTQVQFLSHEFCIASRIDVYTLDKPALEFKESVDDLDFKLLGHLSLDPNQRSGWQARELKSVFVDIECCLLKVVLHEPHPNKLNAHNQVGLVGITCIGDSVAAQRRRVSRADETVSGVDQITSDLIHKVERQKDESTAANDFDAAKKYKEQIDGLMKSGGLIVRLELEKLDAVDAEDYDTAKAIKNQIDSIRRNQLSSISSTEAVSRTIVDNFTSYLKSEDSPIRPTSAYRRDVALPSFGGPAPASPPTTLPVPDPLPSYFSRDYPQLMESLGADVIARLLSRDWRLRDEGLGLVMATIAESKTVDVYGMTWIVQKLISDKIVNVYIKVCDLIQLAAGFTWGEGFHDTIEFSLIHLVESRLADSNRRVVDSAVATIVRIAEVGPTQMQLVSHYLLKRSVQCKSINSRCLALLSLVDSRGVSGRKGLHLESLVSALGDWYASVSAGDTRTVIVQVITACVKKVGIEKVENAINALNDSALRETLLYEISKVPGVTPISTHRHSATCDFCGTSDSAFKDEHRMDVHYWEECPALIECRYCDQVIELTSMTEHRLKECDNADWGDDDSSDR